MLRPLHQHRILQKKQATFHFGLKTKRAAHMLTTLPLTSQRMPAQVHCEVAGSQSARRLEVSMLPFSSSSAVCCPDNPPVTKNFTKLSDDLKLED